MEGPVPPENLSRVLILHSPSSHKPQNCGKGGSSAYKIIPKIHSKCLTVVYLFPLVLLMFGCLLAIYRLVVVAFCWFYFACFVNLLFVNLWLLFVGFGCVLVGFVWFRRMLVIFCGVLAMCCAGSFLGSKVAQRKLLRSRRRSRRSSASVCQRFLHRFSTHIGWAGRLYKVLGPLSIFTLK